MSEENKNEDFYQKDEITDMGSVTVTAGNHTIHCITIVGQIEGHVILSSDTKTTKYEHVMPELASVEESRDIDGLLVLLNTVGGDIEAGLGIAEMIAGMSKPTVSWSLGADILLECRWLCRRSNPLSSHRRQ